ncbi:MAG: hypothetical protein R3D32_07180 [Nitratireductor sp.]
MGQASAFPEARSIPGEVAHRLFPPANAIYRRETFDSYPGARAIMKCVYEGLLLPMDAALRVEAAISHMC